MGGQITKSTIYSHYTIVYLIQEQLHCFHLQNYPNLSQPPPTFSGQYSNSGQFTSAGSSGYGQYQSAPAPGHAAGQQPGHSQYQAQPYAGQGSAVGGYQVRSGGVLNCLNIPPLISGNESISNRRLPATEFNWRVCSYCTRISSTVCNLHTFNQQSCSTPLFASRFVGPMQYVINHLATIYEAHPSI